MTQLIGLRPSELRRLEEDMKYEAKRNIVFEAMMRMLLQETTNTVELIDDVWVAGIQLRNVYDQLDNDQQQAFEKHLDQYCSSLA